MIPAAFILCGLWCGHSPQHGAFTIAPEHGAVHLAGGMNGVFPMLMAGVTAGVGTRLDLSFVYETHAGLAHLVDVGLRLRVADRWAITSSVGFGLFTVEEIGGIQSASAPFGNGLTSTHSVVLSRWNTDRIHVAVAAGFTMRWLVPRESFGVVELEPEVTLHTAHVDVTLEWAARSAGTWWLRFRGTVPVQADFRLFGYLPMVLIGRSWSL